MRLNLNCNSLRILLLAAGFAAVSSTHATDRLFTFVYDASLAPKGTFELENSVTWSVWRHLDDSGDGVGHTHQFDFRHEFEYGVTDQFQLSLYVADWSVLDDSGHNRSARYQDSAVEAIYRLSNPAKDWIGSAVYGEVRVGEKFLELEGKVILQKNFGPIVAAYNATLEAQWEGRHLDERTGEFQESLGLSCELMPQLSVGAEIVHEIEWPEWSKPETSRVFAGPNASFRHGSWYATITPLFQLTNVRDEPDVQTRLIVGVHF